MKMKHYNTFVLRKTLFLFASLLFFSNYTSAQCSIDLPPSIELCSGSVSLSPTINDSNTSCIGVPPSQRCGTTPTTSNGSLDYNFFTPFNRD